MASEISKHKVLEKSKLKGNVQAVLVKSSFSVCPLTRRNRYLLYTRERRYRLGLCFLGYWVNEKIIDADTDAFRLLHRLTYIHNFEVDYGK
jgi:hypothetical protein